MLRSSPARVCSLLFGVALLTQLTVDAWAVFELQVTPRRGGQTIRLEEAEPGKPSRNEEVTVTMVADAGVPYTISQILHQPLTNDSGQTIPPGAWAQFSSSELPGTLRTRLETPVLLGQHPVYTSPEDGGDASFVLVNNVRVPEGQSGGSYRAQFSFIAEPQTAQAGISSQIVTLNVIVDMKPVFKLTVTPEGGAHSVDLGSVGRNRDASASVVTVRIENNTGRNYTLSHGLPEPLTSESGETLGPEDVTFTAQANLSGRTLFASKEPMRSTSAELFSSAEGGSSEEVVVSYQISASPEIRAGSYRGLLELKVLSDSPYAPSDSVDLPVTLDVQEVLDLSVDFVDGSSQGLAFGRLQPGASQIRSVLLSAYSNLGRRYRISQSLSRLLTQAEGKTLPAECLQYSVYKQNLDTPISSPEPVVVGESVVYTSDLHGTPEALTVLYQLSIPEDRVVAGDYSSELRYSLTAA